MKHSVDFNVGILHSFFNLEHPLLCIGVALTLGGVEFLVLLIDMVHPSS